MGEPDPRPRPREAGTPVVTEFLVEPFAEGRPGPHVDAAVEAFTERGIEVELGPFASTVTAPIDPTADAIAAMVRSALAAGATRLRIHVGDRSSERSVGPLHTALEDLFREIEDDVGAEPSVWSRTQKQAAVRLLSERGAFLLKGSVEDVAERMGVSRMTIYNYLAAIETP